MMPPRDVALAFAVTATWGGGLTFSKAAMAQFPPFFMLVVALWLTAFVMQFYAPGTPKTDHLRSALIAFFAITLQSAMIFLALSGMDASTGALLVQVQVPLAIFAAWVFRTEPVKWRKLVPIAIAFCGVGIVVGFPEQAPPLLPTLILFAGAAAWGIGQALIAKYGQDDSDLLLKRTSLHGAVQLTVLTLLFETGQWNAVLTANSVQWAGMLYNAVLSYVVAYVVWFGLLKRNPVSAVSPFIMVIPVVTVVTAALFLGDRIEAAEIIGGAVILLGVAMAIGAVPNRFAK
jgi:O-acetylserine/cysteine efflux transporter